MLDRARDDKDRRLLLVRWNRVRQRTSAPSVPAESRRSRESARTQPVRPSADRALRRGDRCVPCRASGLEQSALYEAVEHRPRLLGCEVQQLARPHGGDPALSAHFVQHLQCLEIERVVVPCRGGGERSEISIRRASRHLRFDPCSGRPRIIRLGPPQRQLIPVDAVHAAPRSLDHSGSLERVGDQRVACLRRRNEQVVDGDAVREAARTAHRQGGSLDGHSDLSAE